jgi:hypothetical protein
VNNIAAQKGQKGKIPGISHTNDSIPMDSDVKNMEAKTSVADRLARG